MSVLKIQERANSRVPFAHMTTIKQPSLIFNHRVIKWAKLVNQKENKREILFKTSKWPLCDRVRTND